MAGAAAANQNVANHRNVVNSIVLSSSDTEIYQFKCWTRPKLPLDAETSETNKLAKPRCLKMLLLHLILPTEKIIKYVSIEKDFFLYWEKQFYKYWIFYGFWNYFNSLYAFSSFAISRRYWENEEWNVNYWIWSENIFLFMHFLYQILDNDIYID